MPYTCGAVIALFFKFETFRTFCLAPWKFCNNSSCHSFKGSKNEKQLLENKAKPIKQNKLCEIKQWKRFSVSCFRWAKSLSLGLPMQVFAKLGKFSMFQKLSIFIRSRKPRLAPKKQTFCDKRHFEKVEPVWTGFFGHQDKSGQSKPPRKAEHFKTWPLWSCLIARKEIFQAR